MAKTRFRRKVVQFLPAPDIQESDLITPTEARELLGVKKQHIQAAMDCSRVTVIEDTEVTMYHGRFRLLRSEVLAWKEKRRQRRKP